MNLSSDACIYIIEALWNDIGIIFTFQDFGDRCKKLHDIVNNNVYLHASGCINLFVALFGNSSDMLATHVSWDLACQFLEDHQLRILSWYYPKRAAIPSAVIRVLLRHTFASSVDWKVDQLAKHINTTHYHVDVCKYVRRCYDAAELRRLALHWLPPTCDGKFARVCNVYIYNLARWGAPLCALHEVTSVARYISGQPVTFTDMTDDVYKLLRNRFSDAERLRRHIETHICDIKLQQYLKTACEKTRHPADSIMVALKPYHYAIVDEGMHAAIARGVSEFDVMLSDIRQEILTMYKLDHADISRDSLARSLWRCHAIASLMHAIHRAQHIRQVISHAEWTFDTTYLDNDKYILSYRHGTLGTFVMQALPCARWMTGWVHKFTVLSRENKTVACCEALNKLAEVAERWASLCHALRNQPDLVVQYENGALDFDTRVCFQHIVHGRYEQMQVVRQMRELYFLYKHTNFEYMCTVVFSKCPSLRKLHTQITKYIKLAALHLYFASHPAWNWQSYPDWDFAAQVSAVTSVPITYAGMFYAYDWYMRIAS